VNRRQAEWSRVPELRMSITFPQRARVAEFHFRELRVFVMGNALGKINNGRFKIAG
jgi:hypothetical protein